MTPAGDTREPKDHHYVPRGYLRGFANGSGDSAFVYVHERGLERPYRKGVKNIAYKNNYYTFTDENGIPNVNVERMLGRVESDAIIVVRRLCENDDFHPGRLDRHKLAFFIALQELRVPWARKDAERSHGEIMKRQIAQLLIQQPQLLPDVPEDIRQRVIQGEGYNVEVDPLHSLRIMLQIAPVLASWYELFKWSLQKVPADETVVTSDNPVIKRAPKDSVFGLGVMNPDIEIIFPLSSAGFLILRHDTDREHEYVLLREAGELDKASEFLKQIPPVDRTQIDAVPVGALNSLIAQYADECVYAKTEQPGLFEFLKLPPGGNRTRIS